MEDSNPQEDTTQYPSSAEGTFQPTINSIFDATYSSLHQVIRQHVAQLPFLDNNNNINNNDAVTDKVSSTDDGKSTEDKLYKVITKVYDNYIDSAQSYVENEIFTIHQDKYSRKKRETILQAYHNVWNGGESVNEGENNNDQQNEINDDTTNDGQSNNDKDSSNNDDDKLIIPKSLSEIPTSEQVKELDEEIISLHTKLNQLKLKNQDIKVQLKCIQSTKALSEKIEEITNSSVAGDTHKLEDAVGAAMIGKDGLEELCQDGRDIIKKLDDIKNTRDDDGNQTQDFSEQIKRASEEAKEAMNRPQKKLTLEEDYEQRLKTNKISTVNGGITSSLLNK